MADQRGPIGVAIDGFQVLVDTELPALFSQYVSRAVYSDIVDLEDAEGATFFVAVQRNGDWPEVVLARRYSPAGYGFAPGVVLVPETQLLFVGAGDRLAAYSLRDPIARLWDDEAEMGFWRWERIGDRVIMSAELELAVWDTAGSKQWTTFVEPPWSYDVVDGQIELDVMGTRTTFGLDSGPQWTTLPWA